MTFLKFCFDTNRFVTNHVDNTEKMFRGGKIENHEDTKCYLTPINQAIKILQC